MKINVIFKKLILKIKTSHFIKNFTIVMSGTVAAQALGFALSPVISRLYSPSDFGVFGSFSSFVGIICAAVTLEYSSALILPKKNEDAFHLFIFSCICTLSIAVFFLIAFFIAPGYFKTLLRSPSSWVLVPVMAAILISGFNQTFQSWCVRAKSFKHTSASQVIRSLTANGMQTGLGFLKCGAPALIWSSVVADFLATMNLARATLRDFKGLTTGYSVRKMLGLAKEYHDFPAYSASMNIMNALSNGLPIFLLTHYYGLAVAGSYAFAMRMLSVPMEFVLRSLRPVLYQKAVETFNDGRKIVPIYIKITGGLFALAIIPSFVFIFWAPQIFGWVFGAKWVTAGVFSQALIIWTAVAFCNLPAIQFSRIIRVQRKLFIYEVLLLLSRTIALVVGGKYLSATSTIMVFSTVGATMNFILILIIGMIIIKRKL